MRYPLLLVTALGWALWLGGTIATFVFGLALFHHLPREQFGPAVDVMFAAWTKYEMAVGVAGLLASGLLMVTYPSRWTIGLFAGLLAALMMAITFGLGLLPIMQGMRQAGQAGSPEYMRLHGKSVTVQLFQSVILVGTGALLVAMAGRPTRQITPADDEPAFPVGV